MEAFYQKEVIEADRDFVEQGIEEMLEKAKDHEVAFLVVGDVFGYKKTPFTKRFFALVKLNLFLIFIQCYYAFRFGAES